MTTNEEVAVLKTNLSTVYKSYSTNLILESTTMCSVSMVIVQAIGQAVQPIVWPNPPG